MCQGRPIPADGTDMGQATSRPLAAAGIRLRPAPGGHLPERGSGTAVECKDDPPDVEKDDAVAQVLLALQRFATLAEAAHGSDGARLRAIEQLPTTIDILRGLNPTQRARVEPPNTNRSHR